MYQPIPTSCTDERAIMASSPEFALALDGSLFQGLELDDIAGEVLGVPHNSCCAQ